MFLEPVYLSIKQKEILDYLKKEGIQYNKIFSERPTLNDVFLELTGKELRD